MGRACIFSIVHGNINAAWKSSVYSHLSMEIPMLHGKAAYIHVLLVDVFFSAVLG